MSAVVRTTWVAIVLRALPGPLLRLLDGWSHRRAQRRARERAARWQRR